ncbi:hypothetical protein ACIQTX_14550 [Microbacterium sp. NPDC090281]|uniref:hypothetical protein n=1 Tax=Microbacterium sp. NPDC090281 TaxID=3364208 RepID=UPI0037FC1AE3
MNLLLQPCGLDLLDPQLFLQNIYRSLQSGYELLPLLALEARFRLKDRQPTDLLTRVVESTFEPFLLVCHSLRSVSQSLEPDAEIRVPSVKLVPSDPGFHRKLKNAVAARSHRSRLSEEDALHSREDVASNRIRFPCDLRIRWNRAGFAHRGLLLFWRLRRARIVDNPLVALGSCQQ